MGTQPLIQAVITQNIEQVKTLLSEGADVNIKTKDGQTPLHIAARNGQVDIVDMLLAKGADFTVQNSNGRTIAGLAKVNGHMEIFELIIKHANQSGDNKEIMTIYDYASIGDIEKVKSLILEGINVNTKSQNGVMALHWASVNGHRNIAELLIQNGADVNVQINSGQTPLLLACQMGKKDVVALLLTKGADFNIKFRNRSPLSYARDNDHTEIVELLRKHGAEE